MVGRTTKHIFKLTRKSKASCGCSPAIPYLWAPGSIARMLVTDAPAAWRWRISGIYQHPIQRELIPSVMIANINILIFGWIHQTLRVRLSHIKAKANW
jgi:hypothetical protein